MAKYKIIPSSRTIVQSPISIGHKAEKGVEAIEFDLTAWVETYGSGTLTVVMRRWGDAIPYPIALEIDENNKATWTLSDIDTAKAGMAYAQLSYIVGETVVKKSDIYTFRVMDSLTGEGDPPEAYESWLEHLTHLAAEAMAEVLDIEGIVTDKTLTVDGGIADAKATGDALSALEDQFSEETDKLKADLDATNGDINKLIGNIQCTWNLGGMYAATGIEYGSSNRIRTPFIKVNPGDTIQIENPDTTLQLSIYEFASNTTTASGINERLTVTYAGDSVKSVTLGDSTHYIRLQLPTEDTLKGDDLLLYTKNSVVFDSIGEYDMLSQEVYPVNKQIFYDLLSYLHPDFTSIRGVLCVKQEDGTYSISGTVTSGTSAIIFNIFSNKTSFPKGIVAGGRYRIFARTNSFLVRVIYYTSESDNGTALLSKSGAFTGDEITIPSNATGLSIRFQYTSPVEGTVYNETKLGVILVPSYELANYARAGIVNNNKAKIYALGNSFMGGAVWINNTYNHLVEYYNSIYGQIAISLGVSQENVDFTMHSSTGLISPSSSYPSFIDTITGVNLAPYDYLLTQMNSSDIRKTGVQLGSENSSDNDGTLAGSVIHLINYIKTSNGKCKLILLSVPPYSSNPATSGNNVFSGVWSNGYSIDDLDTVMYKLAKKYHFIYISWQDLEISYHYMDYADYVEGETSPRHASDDSVYRVIGEYAAMQIKAVSSPIAIGKLLN